MRKMIHQQIPILPVGIQHRHGHELAEVSRVLDELQEGAGLLELISRELLGGRRPDTGRKGLTAEQVLRILVLKQMLGLTYDRLAFQLADSSTSRLFCRIGVMDPTPQKSALQSNLKRLSSGTIEAINRYLLKKAEADGIEKGRTVRGDCTAVETNIHHPSDSSLLHDGVRVLARLLQQLEEATGGLRTYRVDHTRRARRRALQIANARNGVDRVKYYRDLLHITQNTVGYAEAAIAWLEFWQPVTGGLRDLLRVEHLRSELRHYVPLVRQVIRQAERRVIRGEAVEASAKVVSLFEPHTDIIVKGGRETEFGHKVFLTTGTSGLVLDCVVLEGNPADSTLVGPFLERHVQLYGHVPRQVTLDGGFASKDNLDILKRAGVQDAAFHKKRGLLVPDMVRSSWLYRQLVRFRSGIESVISCLKRCFGWTRCEWRSLRSFHSYVWASVLSANVLCLARHWLATAG